MYVEEQKKVLNIADYCIVYLNNYSDNHLYSQLNDIVKFQIRVSDTNEATNIAYINISCRFKA